MAKTMTVREVIARSYPSWDYAMADRLIAWLDHCGYQIVEKKLHESAVLPADDLQPPAINAC
ncbi:MULTISPECIES: hypothetical protein [Bradyrhizobium]|uniref:Uncharacterized protein n=1 Tax=Bradyrhizobium aeschynomenes TaxID=2734909 RepID=A0ABX2C5Y7_9BRAD|nr:MULTISPECIES: hypothetical protein [Bradyrhizobium]NPU13084.1 hypothetical protein [Bradyrhizobium aeschynomenes]NPU63704.1 hypothetical protein [Bradyrhizobium aeschynomenes]